MSTPANNNLRPSPANNNFRPNPAKNFRPSSNPPSSPSSNPPPISLKGVTRRADLVGQGQISQTPPLAPRAKQAPQAELRKPDAAIKPAQEVLKPQTDRVQVERDILKEGLDELSTLCHQLLPFCSGFTTVTHLAAHQDEHLKNLLLLLPAIREIIANFETIKKEPQPFTTIHLYLKMALLLEQSAKLALALKRFAVVEPKGAEPGWEKHAPLYFVKQLIKPTPLTEGEPLKALRPLQPDEEKLLEGLGRVVAITSRYPGLEEKLPPLEKSLLIRKLNSKLPLPLVFKQELNLALQFSLTLLTWASSKIEKSPHAKFADISLEKALSLPIEELQPDAQKRCIQLLTSIQAKIKQIQPLNAGNEKVKNAHAEALMNLTGNFFIFAKFLLTTPKPSLCLVTAQEAFLREGVILEQLLLLLKTKPPDTFFSDKVGRGRLPLRQTHDLPLFVKKVSGLGEELGKETEKWAKELHPILKVLYRYQDPTKTSELAKKLESFAELSKLYQRCIQDRDFARANIEEEFISPAQFETFISNAIVKHVKEPALEFLELINKLLDI